MKDFDMSDVHADARNMLENELFDLDLPMIDIGVILIVLGDAFDIDPKTLLRTRNDPEMTREGRVMLDLLDEALESTTQLPHIERALEIYEALGGV